MTTVSRTAVRFLASLVVAVGLGGGLVAGGYWLMPRVFAALDLDVWNVPHYLAVQAGGPREAARIDNLIGQIDQTRTVKDGIVQSVLTGKLTHDEGLAAFLELFEKDADLQRRLEITLPDLLEVDRVRQHFYFYLNIHRNTPELQVAGPGPTL